MLVDQDNGDVLALDESVERRLDRGGLGLVVDNEEILLGVCTRRDMLRGPLDEFQLLALCETYTNAGKKQARHRVLYRISPVPMITSS